MVTWFASKVNVSNMHVGIEHYSYMSDNTQATTLLYELGSLVRNHFGTKHPMYEFAPAQVKKAFTGNGRADKFDMYRTFLKELHMPNLHTEFSLNPNVKTLQHPIEDIADSLAVCLTTLQHIIPTSP